MVASNYRIKLAARVKKQLEVIYAYIAQHSPQNAAKFIVELHTEFDSLTSMSGRHRIAGKSRKRSTEVHSMVVFPYIIYYEVNRPRRVVTIIEVRHGARRQPKSFD